MLGDNSECAPPESISNSEVKPLSANDSVGFPHVKVGHRQAPYFVALIRHCVPPSPVLREKRNWEQMRESARRGGSLCPTFLES